MHAQWLGLKYNASRTSKTQRKNEQEFLDKMDDLFDIAHVDAIKLMTNEEDKQFLFAQRKKGRPGHLGPVDKKLCKLEQRRLDRIMKESMRNECERKRQRDAVGATSSSIPSCLQEVDSCKSDTGDPNEDPTSSLPSTSTANEYQCHQPKIERSNHSSVVSALDRINISNRKATYINWICCPGHRRRSPGLCNHPQVI